MTSKVTDEDLKNISEHITYEFGMWINIYKILPESKILFSDIIYNALIESFEIHARLLFDFFYKDKKQHDDDVLAQDFFSNPNKPKTWKPIRPKEKKDFEDIKKRINKDIAHLSYERARIPKKERSVNPHLILQNLCCNFKKFLSEIEQELIPSSIREKLQAYISECENLPPVSNGNSATDSVPVNSTTQLN